jgi:hypothetical protein
MVFLKLVIVEYLFGQCSPKMTGIWDWSNGARQRSLGQAGCPWIVEFRIEAAK